MGFSKDSAVKFCQRLERITDALSDVSNNEIAVALGLDKDGMNSALAIVSHEIITNPPAMDAQGNMFQMGVNLGRAYERKLAANADANSAGEDV